MPSFISCLFLVALLVATVLAIPAPVPSYQRKGRSFKVERVSNPTFVKRDGPKSLLKAYRKYAMPVPASLIALENKKKKGSKAAKTATASPAAGTGTATAATNNAAANGTAITSNAATNGTTKQGLVAATPEAGDVEYLSPVNIGGQTMMMDFDSGSSDLWVFSTSLPTASQTGHTNFDSTKSTTFKAITGAKWSISYGDGSGAAGTVGTDTVNIGGATVTGQAVELATAVSTSFVSDTASNGLVGLAYSKLNTVTPNQQKTFFDNAMSTLALPVFTADLRHNVAGSYEFGAIDSTKFTGSLNYANINTTQGFWQFSSNKFQVGTQAAVTTGTTGQAIADTGTTLMIVSTAIANAYYSQVSGAVNDASVGGITFPCNAALPDLSVDIGGAMMATIPGSLINFTAVTGNSKLHFPLY